MTRETARLESWITGAVLLVVSAGAIVAFREWEEWVRLLAGAWMIVAPFVLGFAHTTAMHVSIGIGGAVLFLTLLELFLLHEERPRSPTTAAR
jgi:drug/metabolite transporter (DMT)-like permease